MSKNACRLCYDKKDDPDNYEFYCVSCKTDICSGECLKNHVKHKIYNKLGWKMAENELEQIMENTYKRAFIFKEVTSTETDGNLFNFLKKISDPSQKIIIPLFLDQIDAMKKRIGEFKNKMNGLSEHSEESKEKEKKSQKNENLIVVDQIKKRKNESPLEKVKNRKKILKKMILNL